MRKQLLFFIFFLFTIQGFAQMEKGVVYLKNGSQIKGKYQYTYDQSQVKLYANHNIFVIDTADIKEITKHRRRYKAPASQKSFEPLKYYFNAELGDLIGHEDNSQEDILSVLISANYNLNKHVSIGAGTGVEFFKESCLPLYINLKYDLRNWYSTPFVFLRAGYSFPLEETNYVRQQYHPDYIWRRSSPSYDKLDTKGGLFFNSGLGYKHMYSPNFGMSLSFGYRFQRLSYKEEEQDYRLILDYNRLSIYLGFIF